MITNNYRRFLILLLKFQVIAVCFLLSGCPGFHIHQSLDFDHAKKAQEHFKNAALKDTVKAERERLKVVLENELKTVKRHTLARRDARLLYIIGEGENEGPWQYLEKDINERLEKFGYTFDTFQSVITKISQRPYLSQNIVNSQVRWDQYRSQDPQLPVLSCNLKDGVPKSPAEDISPLRKGDYESYRDDCAKYLEAIDIKVDPSTEKNIAIIKAAQSAVSEEIKNRKEAYEKAKKEYAIALKSNDEDLIAGKASQYKEKVESFGEIAASDKISGKLDNAKKAFAELNINIDDIVDDLMSSAEIARLDVIREQTLAALSAIIDADMNISDDTKSPSSANEYFSLLATVGKAIYKSRNYTPVSSLLIESEMLRIDKAAAEKRKEFFDKTLSLLEQAQSAKEQELIYLGRVEQLRKQISGENGCITEKGNQGVFSTTGNEICQEKVFKLLMAYSNSWTFGRLPQEEIDYKLIALLHEASLDSSELAIERWDALLSVPIDQLVNLHATGLRSEDITTIINTFGLGAIAVGVNN